MSLVNYCSGNTTVSQSRATSIFFELFFNVSFLGLAGLVLRNVCFCVVMLHGVMYRCLKCVVMLHGVMYRCLKCVVMLHAVMYRCLKCVVMLHGVMYLCQCSKFIFIFEVILRNKIATSFHFKSHE